jgi:hypothetical protein
VTRAPSPVLGKVHGLRLDDCIERFSASRKEELGEKTAAAYRFQLDRLRA